MNERLKPKAHTSSAINVNSSTVSPKSPTAETRWSVVVCSSRAKAVTLSAGPGENDSEIFAMWKTDSSQGVFDFPARVQNLTSVYFKARFGK